MSMQRVDIVLPVYKEAVLTKACIDSVLSHLDVERVNRLIIVDDASPEPGLSAMLSDYAEQHTCIQLLVNETNLGFVQSVNRGMAVGSGDVVLLNSDTRVPPGWLERLQRAAYTDANVATVTPFSNNASICSYPYFCESAELPEGLDLEQMDGFFASVNQGLVVDLPTGVGFCMYIRRDCLDTIGLFDAERYGKGYGEENDFSRRAAAAGYRNLLCGELFVYHQGGASFGDQRRALMARAETLLAERYPEYPRVVADFIRQDPLKALRRSVSVARLGSSDQHSVVLAEYDRQLEYQEVALEQARHQVLDTERIYTAELNEHKNALSMYEKRCAEYDSRCAEYDRLLDEVRHSFTRTDEALQQAQRNSLQLQSDLVACHQQLEQLQSSWPFKLQRFIRKFWKFHD
ncbi:glycosyltransferase [Marinobacterium marinum]|uniref:Glycosyltransferase n=1 Tax=Marinobacterium marinum TaxID=2756129 RepID=A0A7W2A9Q5_9GAMM|nr:glycosyltransferase [Marinobacterium marinum]MBA4500996.1 glycosyltransferase [Marinobacterium marinum]